jgi:hypothetical protein
MRSIPTFASIFRQANFPPARRFAAVTLALAAGAALAPMSAHAAVHYTFVTLDNAADPTFNQLLGINNSGLIAGYFGSGAVGHPNKGYLLVPPYGQAEYVNENVPNSVQTQVTGLNNIGTTVGFFSNTNVGGGNDANYGFFNTGGVNGTYSQVIDPHTPNVPVPVNQLLGVNNQDIAVGFYNDADGNAHGYTFNIKTLSFSQDINAPFASSTTAAAINNNGEIAGFDMLGSVTQAFTDNKGHFTTFDVPGSSFTQFFGLNDHGIAVGDYVNAAGNTDGLLFNTLNDQWITLNDPFGVGGTTINGINDKGQLVGFYVDAAGNTNGFLAVDSAAVPELSTWALMLLGFCGLGYAATRSPRNGVGLA